MIEKKRKKIKDDTNILKIRVEEIKGFKTSRKTKKTDVKRQRNKKGVGKLIYIICA